MRPDPSSHRLDRRCFLRAAAGIAGLAATGLGFAGLGGCASAGIWTQGEVDLARAPRDDFDIVVLDPPDSRVLRQRARPVPDGVDLGGVAGRMMRTMNAADGVGIAAPQVGLSIRAVVVMLDSDTETPRTVFARNPVIVERSDETALGWEGCLCLPDVGGRVRRNSRIRVQYTLESGETVIEEAEGFNAVIWQHEIDHLDGVLYIDRLVGDLLPWEEVQRLRAEEREAKKAKEKEADRSQ